MDINLTAPINDLGYGVAGLNILKSLVQIGCNVSYWPIGQSSVHTHEEAEVVKSCTENTKFFNYKAPSLRLWHQHDMAHHIGYGKRVGFPVFELDKFSDIEKHHLSSLDKILVCSQWAKSVVEREVPNSSVSVVPLGVDMSIFNTDQNEPHDQTIFINIGKWEIRKGHDILYQAFSKAFDKDDNVELWMMNHNPFLNQEQENEWHRLYLNSPMGRKIKIIPRVESHMEVAEIMRQVDVGVFPSRAEGWNLEALEMMAMGKYVILTDYSAHTEFASEINSKLIKIDETEEAYDGIWFHGQGEWASFGDSQMEQLVSHMRTLHELNQKEYKENRKNKNERGIITAKKLSWKNSAEKIIEAIT
jgi:glycosyltransferase involved in cell wall biosynthesis